MYTTRTIVQFNGPAIYNRFDSRERATRFARKQSRHELAICVQIYDESMAGMISCYARGHYLPVNQARELMARIEEERKAFDAQCALDAAL